MPARLANRFWRDEGAAIAPLYALALFGLVGIAGVGMDYGRMMAMDSELQNAADQAALAAATQLNGGADAITRARQAATAALATANSDWVNVTRLANDGEGRPITSLTFKFYSGYNATNDTFNGSALSDTQGSSAKVVQVIVNGREVFFALTPVVDAFSSGELSATAVAGLETSVCNVPPLMFCVPSGNTAFPTTTDHGKGVLMHWHEGGNAAWAPGNFGFLNIDYPGIPNNLKNSLTGLNSKFLGCANNVIESRTGNRTPEIRALDSRFDIYGNGQGSVSCDPSTGDFCPSQNSQKNWVVELNQPNTDTPPSGWTCPATPPNNYDWTSAASTANATSPATNTGFPRDTSMGSDGFGDGSWNINAFMTANHPGMSLGTGADLDGNGQVSRYEVYQWELASPSTRLVNGTLVGSNATLKNGHYSGTKYCAYPRPFTGTPVSPSSTQKDRRIITVAAVNCDGLNGQKPVSILRWVDLFLVQPAPMSGSDQNFFAEIVGEADPPGADESAFQSFGRNKPVLLR